MAEGPCAICTVPTTLRCQGCIKGGIENLSIPFYCGKEHQVEHWKSGHKKECGQSKSVCWERKVVNGKVVFLAKKDLKAGEVLFQRKPLLVFPSMPCEGSKQQFLSKSSRDPISKMQLMQGNRITTCVSCLEIIVYGESWQNAEGMRTHKCLDCGWPLHSFIHPAQGLSPCQQAHEKECKIFVARGLGWNQTLAEEGMHIFYELAVLRAHLLPEDKKMEILSLPIESPEMVCAFSQTIARATNFVQNRCGLRLSEGNFLPKILANAMGPFKTDLIHCGRDKSGFILFEGGAILGKDCVPNCKLQVETDLRGTFKTIRPVGKGEVLSMDYLMLDHHFRTVDQRNLAHWTMGLRDPCFCKLCKSPTEDGTFLSAIKCVHAKKAKRKKECQYMYPVYKTGQATHRDFMSWKCACSLCPGSIKLPEVEQIISRLSQEVLMHGNSPNGFEDLQSFIKKHAGVTIHPNHVVILQAKQFMCMTAINQLRSVERHQNGSLNFKEMHKKYLPVFEDLLGILEKIKPGRTFLNGRLLLAKSQLKLTELAEKVETAKISEADVDSELKLILEDMAESMLILGDNPLADKYNLSGEERLQKYYAQYLYDTISAKLPSSLELESVKMLKENYGPFPASLEMSPEEKEFKMIVQIPEEELPKLIQAMKKL